MKIQLENDTLKAEILSKGAELKSLVTKEDGQEYLWEADPAFWGKTSPILFPFIGKLEGAAYLYNDRRYEMEKHGFARDMDFSVKEQEKDRVVFFIKSTEETLRKYPFPFCLEVEYCLGENGIEENVKVYNVLFIGWSSGVCLSAGDGFRQSWKQKGQFYQTLRCGRSKRG